MGLFDLVSEKLKGRSSYYHTLMLGQNMKEHYLDSSDDNSSISVSSMGDDSGFSVMIINKNDTESYEYALGLNDEFPSEKQVNIKVAAGLDRIIFGSINPNTTLMQVFDAKGNLLKRYTYRQSDAENMRPPLIEHFRRCLQPIFLLLLDDKE